jgi:hypothetical protein
MFFSRFGSGSMEDRDRSTNALWEKSAGDEDGFGS